jgi:energy-coupling factor transporter ATP-binding protein EcfA2
MSIATVEHLHYWYPDRATAALVDVNLRLEAGLTVLAGPSGSGKSTLLRLLDGLVPHFHGGTIAGRAAVGGCDVLVTPTRRLAREVGLVFQDPEQQFVSGTVEREVAFGLENLGVAPTAMRERVGEALAAVGAEALRGRSVDSLSGGERQRVALAAALALRPQLVALDEPTSQLDPDGAAALLEACLALVAGGTAVVVAEHRLERLLPAADRLGLLEAGRLEGPLPPARLAEQLTTAPAIVRLGRRLGWSPLPLSVEAAHERRPALGDGARSSAAAAGRTRPSALAWSVRGLTVGYGGRVVLEGVELAGGQGEIVVLMGPNGGGKTTFLRTLGGLLRPRSGRVERLAGRIAYLPQDPAALLHRPTVRAEVEATLRWAGSREPAGRILGELGLLAAAERYPRDLSSGERQRAAIATVLAARPAIALLDEPTRGMDGSARDRLVRVLRRLREEGCAVVVATHDSDLAAEVADRVVRVEDGRLVDLGCPDRALSGATPWATQVGQLYPGGPVTVEGVLARLAGPVDDGRSAMDRAVDASGARRLGAVPTAGANERTCP